MSAERLVEVTISEFVDVIDQREDGTIFVERVRVAQGPTRISCIAADCLALPDEEEKPF
jgi:hypothetical protein